MACGSMEESSRAISSCTPGLLPIETDSLLGTGVVQLFRMGGTDATCGRDCINRLLLHSALPPAASRCATACTRAPGDGIEEPDLLIVHDMLEVPTDQDVDFACRGECNVKAVVVELTWV